MWPAGGQAHDASAWGGLFRSRDNGATWFQANQGRLVTGALSVAVSPVDSTQVLLGTDGGLLATRNGGRDWAEVAPGVLGGRPVFATLIDPDGRGSLVASDRGFFRSDDGLAWQPVAPPSGSSPARALLRGLEADEVYLVGWQGVFRSANRGATWEPIDHELPPGQPTSLVVLPGALLLSVGGNVWTSPDSGVSWTAGASGLPSNAIHTLASASGSNSVVWAGGVDRIFRSDDRGLSWRAIGQPLPEARTEIRGVVADAEGTSILVSSHRGLYASTDGGMSWALLTDNLPGHLEAGPLIADPAQPGVVYVGYSLHPYTEQWARAAEGRVTAPLSWVDLTGAAAFLLLLGLLAAVALQWLDQRRKAGDRLAAKGAQ